MATVVAELLGVLSFRAQGEQEAIRAAEEVRKRFIGVESAAHGAAIEMQTLQNAEAALAATANTTSAAIAKQRAELQDAVNSYKQGTVAIDQYVAQISKAGSSVATLSTDLARLRKEYDNVSLALSKANNEVRELERERTRLQSQSLSAQLRRDEVEVQRLSKALDDLAKKLSVAASRRDALAGRESSLRGRVGQLAPFEELLASEGGVRTEALTRMERLTRRMGGAGKEAAQGLRLTNGELGRVFTQLATGRVAISGFTELIGRMALAVKGAIPILIGLAVTVGPIVAAFALAHSELGKFSQQLAAVSDDTQAFIREGVLGATGSQLLQTVQVAQNRLRSQGVDRPEAGAQQIAKLAENAQFLFPGTGDFTRTAETIQRSIETLNFEGLRDGGFEVSALNNEFERLAAEGVSKAERQTLAYLRIQEQMNSRMNEAHRQADAERTSLEGIGQTFQKIITQIAASEGFQKAIDGFLDSLETAGPLLTVLAGGFGRFFAFVVNVGTKAFILLQLYIKEFLELLATGLAGISKLPGIDFTDQVEGIRRVTDDMEESIKAAVRGTKGWNFELEATSGTIEGFENDLENAKSAVERLQDALRARSEGFGIVDQVKSLGQAVLELNAETNTSNAVNALQNYEAVLASVVEKGPNQLKLLRLQAEALLRSGFFNQAEFDAAIAGFDAIEAVIRPMEGEAKRIRDSINEQANATTGVTTGFNNATSSASALNGQIATGIGLTHELANAAASISFSGIRGGGAVGGPKLGFSGNLSPTSTRVPGGGRTIVRPGMTANEIDWQARDRERIGSGEEIRTAVEKVSQAFDLGVGGGGGGGGGGGAKSLGASIEEIRQLFRNIGNLIKIGVNNGVFFSPAGNTIPLGGRNEFLNTKGGTLIQTVNIRGIWDFADPAAKRQILKELEEAIAGLKKELA